jgi:hypothetical protein
MSVVFLYPDRGGAADDVGCWERTEVATVERMFGPPVHKEHVMVGDHSAAFPARQGPSATIVLERMTLGHSIDDDRPANAADIVTWKGGDMLQERHAACKIAARVKEGASDSGGLTTTRSPTLCALVGAAE